MYHYNLGMLFDDVVKTYAERPALRFSEQEFSYAAVHNMSIDCAALLLERGCHQGDVIAIAHTKQVQSYALMLAALRLGIPYVNIDAASPLSRTLMILHTSEAKLLFCDNPAYAEGMCELAEQAGCALCIMDAEHLPASASLSSRTQQEALMPLVDGATLAYIMFTSGSTGVPKGVAVTHQNVLHFIDWGQQCFDVTPEDIFANLSPMYFDNSVFDFYTAMFSGASLVPVPRELLTEPYALVAHVAHMRCTLWFCVPSLLIYLMTMKALRADALPCVRSFSFGGEGYPKVELKKLFTMFSAQARLVNVYGPTECTCICSAYVLSEADFVDTDGLPTLGRLNQNFAYKILDADGKDAFEGELCLMGPNVSAGYFNDPQRTDASFVTLLEPRNYQKRMYRTGDIVREQSGNLYFVGRKDNQIKHMGYRIELEEIENALIRLPQVTQAAVVYQRGNTAYGKILAYVASDTALAAKDVVAQLNLLLPTYMIPNKISVMDTLPKNANGKVDRQALKNMR